MPQLPAVAKVVRIDFHLSQTGNPNAQIREFYQYGGTLSATDAQTWVNAIGLSFRTNIMPLLVTSVGLVSTVLTDLSSSTSPQAIDGTTLSGSVTNAPLPNGLSLVFKKKIARRYRGGHPRLYLPGLDVTTLTSSDAFVSTVLSTFLSHYNTFNTSNISGVPTAASPATHVNVSYFAGFTNKTFPSGRTHPVPNLRATPVVDPIISVSMNPVPASQRRRNQNP